MPTPMRWRASPDRKTASHDVLTNAWQPVSGGSLRFSSCLGGGGRRQYPRLTNRKPPPAGIPIMPPSSSFQHATLDLIRHPCQTVGLAGMAAQWLAAA
jgi:hypothetical protein